MNCIWILLILFCSGNNGCGSTWSNGCGNWNIGCNQCNRCGCNNNCWRETCRDCENNRGGNQNSTRETMCETVCEAVRDAVNEASEQQDCGCRRNFPYTSYPVLDNCK